MDTNRRILVFWLACVCLVIYLMIVVGGVTRLTQSGLSMVDWRPITGIIPPLTEQDWQAEFEAYKQFPEYKKINYGMDLEGFKSIFYWEYGHRVLGRVIGMLYFIPFVALLLLRRVPDGFKGRLWIGFLLGGLQGLMGWYMVKSGLVDRPHVSHFRLAAHLLLAIAILGYLFWIVLDLLDVRREKVSVGMRWLLLGVSGLLFVQFLFGAFTAGLDAGKGFNTWPLMYGQFLADAAVMMSPFWHNFVENGVMIQFVHRWVGALVVLGVLGILALSFSSRRLLVPAVVLVVVTLVQFALGVYTLLMSVPVVAGSLHQAVACLIVLAMVYLLYLTGGRERMS